MRALIVIDVQNEFTGIGQRPVPNVDSALTAIEKQVVRAREKGEPIVWIRHFNKPGESPAFVPGTWGAEFIEGFGPLAGAANEIEMHKSVYGTFTGTKIGKWLEDKGISKVLIMGFYTHACVSTTTREAIMRDLVVYLDPEATGSCNMEHPVLGNLTAEESRRVALVQLADMGALIINHSAEGKSVN